MKKQTLTLANYLVFLLITLFCTVLQSSIWPQLFGNFPAPQFWITTLAYWVMGRHLIEGLIMTYLLSFLVSTLTAMPISLILAINVILLCGGFLLKQRILWVSSTYLMILSGLGSLLFPVVHFTLSWFFEASPIRFPEILHWAFTSLFYILLSPLFFFVFRALDQLTSKELPSEIRSDIL